MSLHDSPPRLTYEDYLLFPNDGKRHEIIDGELYVTAAPSVRHQKLVVRFTLRVGGFIEEHQLGYFLVAPTDVVLSPHHVLQPDLLFVSNEREPILREKNVQGAPDLVIEILSEATRRLDIVVKRQAYERFGVQEYWLVDPRRQSVEVWTLMAEGYRRGAVLKAEEGDVLTTMLLLGLGISLAEIFKKENMLTTPQCCQGVA